MIKGSVPDMNEEDNVVQSEMEAPPKIMKKESPKEEFNEIKEQEENDYSPIEIKEKPGIIKKDSSS
jgi:hypothetical protein